MCDKNGILALTTNLKRNYRSEGIVYIDDGDRENGEKPYKRSNSMGKINLKLEKLDSFTSLQTVPIDKNNLDLVKRFVYALCQEYLGGIWKRISIDEFELSKPNGGLSNHLYKCELKSNELQPVHNEPRKIFVRLYGDCHQNNSSAMLKDIIVSTILSDFSMGPKLYGIFPAGRLEELIDASPMDYKDMFNPEFSCQIAQVMAQFHTLEMPFVKKPNWLFDTTSNYINQIKQHTFSDELDVKRFNKLKSFHLEKEFSELK
jgi:choline/ethanolamine kinase